MKRGTTFEAEIEDFADKGKGIVRLDGFVVFVRDGVPGDRVKARVYKKKKKYAEAEIDELIEPSDKRTEPRCFYYPTCGGCTRQQIAYDAQLQAKRESVEGAFIQHGGLPDGVEVKPVLPAPSEYRYRNKMAFDFSADRWLTPKEIDTNKRYDKDFALGMHPPSKPFKVIDLKECHLPHETTPEITNSVREFVKEREWAPWHIRKHEGFLRHLVIRTGMKTGEIMVNLVTNGYEPDRMEALAAFLQEEHPEIDTLINTISTDVAQTEYGEAEHIIFGPGIIHDEIGKYRFEIAPTAFFQTNTHQAERLYDLAVEAANLQPDDHVYDLYCGTGSISIYLSEHVERVTGIEMVEEAVQNARSNAENNGVENCTFVQADMRDSLDDAFVEEHGQPDVLVCDPPRAGMHKKVVRRIGELAPDRIAYVSCNPHTQARDIERLSDAYEVQAIRPVDMFPQTDHVENVVSLIRKG